MQVNSLNKELVINPKCLPLTLGWKGQDGSPPALTALSIFTGARMGTRGPRGPVADDTVRRTRDFTSHNFRTGKLRAEVMCYLLA